MLFHVSPRFFYLLICCYSSVLGDSNWTETKSTIKSGGGRGGGLFGPSKTKSQGVLRAKFCVCRSYRGKTVGGRAFCRGPPPPPSWIGLRASDTYRDCLSFLYFQIIQKRILRISLIDLLLPLEFSLCSMMCYCLQSLQSLCHHKK